MTDPAAGAEGRVVARLVDHADKHVGPGHGDDLVLFAVLADGANVGHHVRHRGVELVVALYRVVRVAGDRAGRLIIRTPTGYYRVFTIK